MKAFFRTNLDEPQPFMSQLAGQDAAHYRVGDQVEFKVGKRNVFHLEVIAKTHQPYRNSTLVELHMPKWQNETMSIREWSEWFQRHVLGREL